MGTHTHTQPFYSSLDFIRDNPGKPVPEETLYGHMLQKEDNGWVKKCMEFEVEGARPRGRPKKTWTKIVKKDCRAHGLNREEAIGHIRWMKQIRDDWWPWHVWVGECFFWYLVTQVVPDKIQRAIKWLCVCVCMCVWVWVCVCYFYSSCDHELSIRSVTVTFRFDLDGIKMNEHVTSIGPRSFCLKVTIQTHTRTNI